MITCIFQTIITFDSDKRHDYLTGFSSRKKERRAFGLAMQKVKDRQSKLEERKGMYISYYVQVIICTYYKLTCKLTKSVQYKRTKRSTTRKD